MLKLIIADDESIIRETISRIIDWRENDIELVGLCKNGLEAYDAILDESPDIVLTDIRMPGMDGLELIRRISATDLNTQFIILSGYGEFEYAKTAMKYGVKHYLLKPCNELQILESVRDIAKDCYRKSTGIASSKTTSNLYNHVLFSILNDALYQNRSCHELLETYNPYMDFHFTPYRLLYVYFLEQEHLSDMLSALKTYSEKHFPTITIHGIYVNHTLLLFFRDFAGNLQDFKNYISAMKFDGDRIRPETEEHAFKNLQTLLEVVLEKVKRYSMIYYINDFRPLPSCNYSYIIKETEKLAAISMEGDENAIDTLIELMNGIDNLAFFKQLANALMLKITAANAALSTVDLTEWMLQENQEIDLESLKLSLADRLRRLLNTRPKEGNLSSTVAQICDYVNAHLSDSNLTLKMIAEQHLFMNTDYVSKKFQRETGSRFSNYLTDMRIERAKRLLASADADKIQSIAEQVGCGNNPQYFSQLFKKKTGMTPTAYLAQFNRKEG